MKNILTIVICLFTFNCFAQSDIEQSISSIEKTNPRPFENGFLFSIKKNDKQSFVLGTIHAGLSENQILGDKIIKYASSSSKIFVEANISDEIQDRNLIMSAGIEKRKVDLLDIIGKTYYDFFRDMFVNRYKILSEEEFRSSKPWFLAMLIPVSDPSKEAYGKIEYGTEFQLINFARKNHIVVDELEGVPEQLIVFNSLKASDEGAYFSDYVDLIQERTLYHWQLDEIAAWTNRDVAGIENVVKSMMERNMPYTNFYISKFIKLRNITLAQKISAIASSRDACFFAIGSEHLVGQGSVIDRLRSAGFIVTPI